MEKTAPVWEKDGFVLRLSRPEEALPYYRQNLNPLDPETTRLTGSPERFEEDAAVRFFLQRPEHRPGAQRQARRKKPSPQHHCPGVVRQSLKQQTIDRLSQGLGAVGRSQHRGHHLSQQIRRGLPLHGG